MVAGVAIPADGGAIPAGIRPGSTYWSSLDGMRGLLMILIYSYHAYPPTVPGASLTIDYFFVASAFLITVLLVREHQRTGRISLRAFYRRRALRLLPALVVTIPAAAAAAWWLIPAQRSEVWPALKSVVFYYANFRAAEHPEEMSVFLPMWSLATEEQFYVVWPTLLLVLLALRARPKALVALLAILTVAATVWLQVAVERGVPLSAVSFRPDLRITGILIGTLVGLLHAYGMVPRSAKPVVQTVTLVGTAFVLLFFVKPFLFPTRFLNSLVIVAACVVFAALVLQQVRWPLAPYTWLLALPTMIWLGRASYALYLVHVPILRSIDAVLDRPSPLIKWSLGAALTLAIGGAIHTWIEKPALRRKERVRSTAPAT